MNLNLDDRPHEATDPIGSLRDAAVRVLPIAPERADAIADQVRELDRQTRAFVREHPMATLAGAVAVGFAVGRVLRG